MADQADVENALVALCATSLGLTGYLAGAYAAASTGTTVTIYRGWPTDTRLYQDVSAGNAHISVYSDPGMVRNVSRWMQDAAQVATLTPTIAVTVSGVTATLSGTITAGNVVGVRFGAPLAAHAYIVQASDTLASVAAALAARSGGTASGATVTLPSALYLTAGTMTPQPYMTVTRQQAQGVRISIWAPSPPARDALAGTLDNALAGLKGASGFLTRFFAVTAYESAKIDFRSTYSADMPSRDRVWRRDLLYTVEYPTTLLEQDPQMLFWGGTETIGVTGTTRQLGALPPP